MEVLLRHVFRCVSFNFDDRLRLRFLEGVDEAFSEEDLLQVIEEKGFPAPSEKDKTMRSKVDDMMIEKTYKSESMD